MNMKKHILLIIVMGSLTANAYSQKWDVDYGIQAGVNTPGYHISNIRSGVGREVSSTYNGFISGFVTFSPNKYFGIGTGLSLMGLGAKLDRSEYGNTAVTQHGYWLQIPAYVTGKLPLRDSSYFFLKAGPYLGLGLFGVNDVPDNYTGSAASEFRFADDGTQRPVDYGFNTAIGYRFKKGYSLAVGYVYGIRDLAPDGAAYEQRNRAYSIAIGYHF